MSKRFTDSEKWKKPFIRGLQGAYKLLWFYILDNCDHAGIWDVEWDVAELRVGENIDPNKAIDLFKEKIIIFDKSKKWFIPSFIEFQYGELNSDNRVHKSIIIILERYDLFKGLKRPLQGRKDKDIDMDKDKEKVKEKERRFSEIWKLYPRKKGKEKAFIHFKAQVKTDKDFDNIKLAVKNYISQIKTEGTKEQFIKHGSTWFNNDWRDDVNYKSQAHKGEDSRDGEKIIKDLNYDKTNQEDID